MRSARLPRSSEMFQSTSKSNDPRTVKLLQSTLRRKGPAGWNEKHE